ARGRGGPQSGPGRRVADPVIPRTSQDAQAPRDGNGEVNLLVVGISHRSAAVETLERLAVDTEAGTSLAQRLLRGGEVREAVVLSTCNRVEVYAAAAGFHGALSAIVDELGELWGGFTEAPADGEAERVGTALDFASCGYVRHGADAVSHIFRVAAGL